MGGSTWRSSRENPGLHVFAPYWRGAPRPEADYTCRCGATGQAIGEHAVKALIGEYLAHRAIHDSKRQDDAQPHTGRPSHPHRSSARATTTERAALFEDVNA